MKIKKHHKGNDTVQLTIKIKLIPMKEQKLHIQDTCLEYIKTVNDTVSLMVAENKSLKLTSKDIIANLPSAVKNQAIRDSKSVYSKYKKTKIQSFLKKPMCIWNNQNYSIGENYIAFPVMINGKSKKIKVKAIIEQYQKDLLTNKLGTLRITKKANKLMAQISIDVVEKENVNNKAMGIDLGLKIPAVAVTEDKKVKFFGNGRQNKYIKRKYRSLRKKLGKAKKINKIKSINDKEQRYMKDQDHKISRGIVNFAIQNNISVIRLEKLTNIRNTAKTNRKNEKNLHTWSFYRLAQYIEYKALLEGIKIEYVNPCNTSKQCPICGKLNTAKDRKYQCSCGYKAHRDLNACINIINATVVDGNSLQA
ncbi:RNA-guided endonuclease InsQ/TnpB family protein [Clostridium tetani]|uniref:RNA-guided endonuclease InsQ/TnpB family protein n=1 Tax=Clostridium tetani TaxID=1513 RepID=UPI001FB0DA30|nr:transposase [Clostridium tetani]